MKKLFLIGFMAIGAANADLIPNLQSGSPTCVGDMNATDVEGASTGERCTWSYSVNLTQNSQLQEGGNGEFVVIYDFDGYIGGSVSMTAPWIGSAGNPGPVGFRQDVVGLDGDTVNLVWNYTGPAVTGPQQWVVTADSIYKNKQEGWYTGTSWKSGDSNGLQGNIGTTVVPAPPGQGGGEIPEPMSMMLLGGGLAGLGMLRLRKK